MRQLKSTLFFLLIISCATTKKTNTKSFTLNGTWIPVMQEFSGMTLPPVSFEKQKLVMSDSSYTLTAESVDKGTITYSDGKMDIYGKEGVNSGKHFMAIYKLVNEQLTICYNLAGDSYPELFETKGKPLFFLSVFKKE